MRNMSNKIDFNNSTYYYRSTNLAPIIFIGFKGPLHIYSEIKKWWNINRKRRKK